MFGFVECVRDMNESHRSTGGNDVSFRVLFAFSQIHLL